MTDPAAQGARSANRGPGRWNRATPLDYYQKYRQPVSDQLGEIVQTAVRSFLARDDEAPWLEVACGGGQLRAWLPVETRPRVLHTDGSAAMLRQFAQSHPDTRVMQADAAALPVHAGTQAAVLGLCACDSIPRLDAVRDEIRRVLRPGGVFIHFLDMQSDPQPLFASLVASGRVPLPNFVDAPPIISQLSPEQRGRLPAPSPLDDFLSVEFQPLAALLEFLESTGSPLAAAIAPLVHHFDPQRFNAYQGTEAFMQILAEPRELGQVCSTLLQLVLEFGQGQHPGVPPLPIEPVATVRYVQSMLQREFGPDHGFETLFSELVSSRAARTREPGMPPNQRYHLRCVGSSVWRREIPEHPLGRPLSEMPHAPRQAPAGDHPEGEVVIETGMLVFVARRAG